MERRDSSFACFILGALVGAIAGILFAPRSGKETREMLKKSYEEYSEKGKEIFEEKKEQLEEAIEAGKKTVEEKSEELKGKFGEIKEKVSERVSEIRTRGKEEHVEELPKETRG